MRCELYTALKVDDLQSLLQQCKYMDILCVFVNTPHPQREQLWPCVWSTVVVGDLLVTMEATVDVCPAGDCFPAYSPVHCQIIGV